MSAWVIAIAAGCGQDPGAGDDDGRGGDRGSAPAAPTGKDAGAVDTPEPDAAMNELPPVDPRCVAPAGAPTAPSTIAEVARLLNALPKPVSVSCFVDALARPLSLQAVDSTFSAQPAQGRGNPRVFIFFPGLILSVVPAGPGVHLLEMGEHRPEDQSLKAELEFPITTELDEAAPYHRVFYSDAITTCGFCHQGETRAEEVASPLAFVSPALRPRPYQRVALSELREHVGSCDADTEPERCALLQALFRVERPLEQEFPMSYKTFF